MASSVYLRAETSNFGCDDGGLPSKTVGPLDSESEIFGGFFRDRFC